MSGAGCTVSGESSLHCAQSATRAKNFTNRGEVSAARGSCVHQRAHALLGDAMQIGEGIQLMHQPLGMYAAQRVLTNCELARVATHNDPSGAAAHAPGRCPTARLPWRSDWIRCDLQHIDVKAIEMRLPDGLIGEPCRRCAANWSMTDLAKAPHIVQRRVVDDITPVRSRSRKFNRRLLGRVANQAKSSLPICVQKPFLPVWRAPVSSTETRPPSAGLPAARHGSRRGNRPVRRSG